MPGPSNCKRKQKSQSKSQKKRSLGSGKPLSCAGKPSPPPAHLQPEHDPASFDSSSASSPLRTPPPLPFLDANFTIKNIPIPEIDCSQIEHIICKQPFIHDPGNGPRVRDTRAFLASPFFAQPPAFDVPLCAEFAQEEVLQMLCTVLPEETALILWYNKSRATSRICPACQRLYKLGDVLPDHMDDGQQRPQKTPPPQLKAEQMISGLCSPVCFILSSFNFPGAIKSAWGRMAGELNDETWDLLNGPEEGRAQGDVGRALGMVVKMTRLDDLGLAQLCFGQQEGGTSLDLLIDPSGIGLPAH